jgi:hypothetical protein
VTRHTLTAVLVALLATMLAEAAPARAAAPRPGASSVAQYVELVPTAAGPKAPGVEVERRLPLSPEAKRALEGAPKATAVALLAVATSSTYGAPSRLGTGTSGPIARETRATSQSPAGNRESLEAIAAAVAPAGDMRMIGLLVILAATTVAAGAFSLRRRL